MIYLKFEINRINFEKRLKLSEYSKIKLSFSKCLILFLFIVNIKNFQLTKRFYFRQIRKINL